MGQIVLPASGKIYFDANIFVYSIEETNPYWSVIQPLWQAIQIQSLTVITSELTLLEVLVKPLQRNDTVTEMACRSLLASPEVELIVPCL